MNRSTTITLASLFALASLAGTTMAQTCLTQTKLLGSSPALNDQFGSGVSMTFGGTNNQPLLAIGKPYEDAPNAGADAGGWSIWGWANNHWTMLSDAWNTTGQTGERAGASVSIADPYMIVGAPGYNNNQGRARIMNRIGGTNSFSPVTDVTIDAPITPANAGFGSAVAISSQLGGWAVVGAPRHSWNFAESGSVYFYVRNATTGQWFEMMHLKGFMDGGEAGDHRGEAVAMSQSTPWAAVGSPDRSDTGQPAGCGRVGVYKFATDVILNGFDLFSSPTPEAGERFGAALAMEGNWLAVGAPMEDATLQETSGQYSATNCGAVYLYELQAPNNWVYRSKIRANAPTTDGNFGSTLAMSDTQFTVSEPGTGRVYVYSRVNEEWVPQTSLRDTDAAASGSYGNALAIYQGRVAIGDKMDDHSSTTDVGAVYTTTVQPSLATGDTCSTAIAMPTGNYTGCTSTATPSIGTITTCGIGGSGQGNDVWFRFEPQCDGNAIVDTFGSDFDTVLSIHSDCPDAQGGHSIVCNDDASFAPPNNRCSLVTFNFQGGNSYLVRVAGYNGANGQFTLRSLMSYGVNNDECSTAPTVAMSSFNFNTCAATNSAPAGVPFGSNRDVWYRFIAPTTGWYSIDTCGSLFDTVLTVFSGTQQACPSSASALISQNDDSVGFCETLVVSSQSRVKLQATQGQSMMIRVGGFDMNEFGRGTLTIAQTTQCNDIDFNNDGSVFDPMDIEAFLSRYSEGPCVPAAYNCDSIDFNNDTSIFDPMDINAFLSVYSEGPCF